MLVTRKFPVLLILSLIFFCFSCDANIKIEETMERKIQQIKKEYASDTRVEIFDIDVKYRGGGLYFEGVTSSQKAYDRINQIIKNSPQKNITNQVRLLPEKNLEYKHGIINLSVGNIRSESNHPSQLVTQALLGTPVKIFQKDSWWYRIQTPDNYIGWIDATGVFEMKKEDLKKWNDSEKIIFTDHFGSIYQKQDKSSQIVSDVVMGNILKLIETLPDWYKVNFPDSRTGYIEKDKAKTIEEWQNQIEISGESIVRLAKSFLGIPYLWGGTSIKGADCSGFVKSVYFMHGIILQRDASQQVNYGQPVPIEENYDQLQPGDLLFFGKNRITHVGIYIGDYEFIHASGRVKINSLNKEAPNYSKGREESLSKARRIVNSLGEKGISPFKENKYYQ